MTIAASLALLVSSVCPLPQEGEPKLRLAAVFGDHMVLQRETSAPIWGWATPGQSVTVATSWTATQRNKRVIIATVDANGRWRATLRTPVAGGPHTITVSSGSEKIQLEDVLAGEVWVCSGQSNMEWPLRACRDAEKEIAAAKYPRIRLFDVARATSMQPVDDCTGTWRVCDPSTIAGFSAVGYFFGRKLRGELDVPIGLVGTNWGGTVAEAWTSDATLRAGFPEFAPTLERVAQELANPGAGQTLASKQAAWWSKLESVDPGVRGRWMEASHDAASWGTATVPGTWAQIDLAGFDGCVWYRRDVEVPAAWRTRDLWLEIGPVDDMDLTYFNGKLVGETRTGNRWNQPRRYRIPAGAAVTGKNTIAVCAVDTGGVGRLGADAAKMRLVPVGENDAAVPLAGGWRFRAGAKLGDIGAFPRGSWFHQNSPTALYNGMIAPLVPFAIRGAIWYQGESNRTRASQYRKLFPAMITDWRERWGRGEFPFYFVQIAPFGYGGDRGEAAALREAQAMTLATANTGMAVTMDIGNPRDIHPRNKQDVGYRLALWALAKTYGKYVAYSGPVYSTMKMEGDAIRLHFDYADGLTSGDTAPSHFTVAGLDKVFHPAVARIDGQTVVVRSAAVSAPLAVRYAWGAADQGSLRNAAGLPASSFRTDDWSPVTGKR